MFISRVSRHRFGAYSALLLLEILSTIHRCSARKINNYCPPSSCGNFDHISYPFRLSNDPESCGNKNYELACENNERLTLHLNMVKYYVQAINYSDFSIRIVDASVQKDDCFSVPHPLSFRRLDYSVKSHSTLVFITCENPIRSPLSYVMDTSSCKNGSSTAYNSSSSSSSISSPSFINMEGYSYVMVGVVYSADIPDLCLVNLIYPVPGFQILPENMTSMSSYIDVHEVLTYGIELSWYSACCDSGKASRCGYFNKTTMRTYCVGIVVNCFLKGIDWTVNRIMAIWLKVVWLKVRYLQDGNEMSYRSRTTMDSNLLTIFINLLMTLLLMLLVLIVMYHVLLFSCGLPCLLSLLIYKWRARHLSMYDNIEKFLQSQDNDLMPIRYTYSEIKKITNGFIDKLGAGGFGSVYKGKLCSGRFAAVKLLSNSKANGQDFINEVATIGRIHHVNVVQLLGFTVEGSKQALIYEFMPNGSLEKYIFSKQGSVPLSNEKLYEISLGVARGIEYLHQGCDMQILHFDIKPHNILLDEKFVPKISDFGLAKLYPTNNNTVPLTAARGTLGYMAPELFYKNIGGVSYKADVYSYGMLLMDMVGRRKNLHASVNHSSQIYFPSWVYDQVSEGKDIEDATEHEKKTTKKMIIVALWCIQLKPGDRPSMHKVVEMLESDVESLQMPPKPFLTPHQVQEDGDRGNHAKLSDPPNICIDSSYQFGR